MASFARLLILLGCGLAALRGQTPLENAERAQALLGPEVWSRVIRIQNDAPGPPYPRIVHALVFELVGILWFYCDANGTQSFSVHAGRLAQDKGDFTPLLAEIAAGFGRWSVVERRRNGAGFKSPPLRNGCFIESVVALRERVAQGIETEEPRLLSYYATTPAGRKGHTVLACISGGMVEIFDPGRPAKNWVFPKAVAADPLALARALEGQAIETARYLALVGAARRAA